MKLYIICFLIIIACLFIQLKRAEGFETQEPTFHIFIATGGRPSLKNMLDSLKDELKPNDAITVVFDGPGSTAKSGLDDSWLEVLTFELVFSSQYKLERFFIFMGEKRNFTTE